MFKERVAKAYKEAERKADLYKRADELLEELGLVELGPLVVSDIVWQNGSYETDRSNPDFPTLKYENAYRDGVPVVYFKLCIPWESKREAVGIVMRDGAVDKWRKRGSISEGRHNRPHYYEETLIYTSDESNHRLRDEVHITFYRPVAVGEEINGCTVQATKRESTGVSLVCQLEGE